MSSAMVHLTCAKLYDPGAPTLFYTGNIVPDLLSAREAKDITHFRHLPTEQRMEALLRFGETLDLSDPLEKGVLLHLFLDLHWDKVGYEPYRKAHEEEEGWFARYRQEIFLASAHLYHHTSGARELFFEMNRTFLPIGKTYPCGITREGTQAFVSGTWYRLLNATEAVSTASPPSFTLPFARDVAEAFRKQFS